MLKINFVNKLKVGKMQKINSYLVHDWILAIETRFEMESEERQALPLYQIILDFKCYIESDQQDLNDKEKIELAQKIKVLSEEKIEYYRSSRFGFIKQIFSTLRNGWLIGRWQSSGQIGLELSQQVLNQTSLEQPNEEDSEAIPTWIKKKLQRQKKKQEGKDKTNKQIQIIGKNLPSIPPIDDSQKPIQNSSKVEFIQDDDSKKVSVEEQPVQKINEIHQEDQKIGRQDLDSESDQIDLPKEKSTPILLKNIQVAQSPKIKTPLEEMIETFQTVWKNAGSAKIVFAQKIWKVMMNKAEVLSWKPTDQANEYQLELKREVFGNHSQIPIGYFVLKQNMKIAFSEKYDSASRLYQQIITFSDNGICHRVGKGWFSKETPIEHVIIEEDFYQDIWCGAEVLGRQVEIPSNEILEFLMETEWS